MLALQASRLEIPFMSDHLRGLLLTTLGVLFVIPDALFVRLIGGEPLVTSFWRGMVSGGLIFLAVLLFQGRGAFVAVARTGWTGVIYIVLLGSTNIGFVLAITLTSVANVVFILASAPIFATLFSRIFLGEPIRMRMVLTMAVVMLGLAIIASGSAGSNVASWQGDLCALYVSAAYAAALTAVRRVKDVAMIPAIPVAYIGAALVIACLTSPMPTFAAQWPLFLAHGAIIAAASCLLTLGPRYISSGEVSLLILLESVLAPLLVWAVIGEDPGPLALIGGAIVIGALVVSNLIALRSMRPA